MRVWLKAECPAQRRERRAADCEESQWAEEVSAFHRIIRCFCVLFCPCVQCQCSSVFSCCTLSSTESLEHLCALDHSSTAFGLAQGRSAEKERTKCNTDFTCFVACFLCLLSCFLASLLSCFLSLFLSCLLHCFLLFLFLARLEVDFSSLLFELLVLCIALFKTLFLNALAGIFSGLAKQCFVAGAFGIFRAKAIGAYVTRLQSMFRHLFGLEPSSTFF